ncbi:MAG: GNAT family N-acetyltransferase [Pseudomonadota bacterium]
MAVKLCELEAALWLDRPIWSALVTRHQRFAQVMGSARRLMPDIGPFAATAVDTAENLDALTRLVAASGHGVTLMQAGGITLPDALPVGGTALGVQMLAERSIRRVRPDGVTRLGPSDIPAMLALTELTEPGPFAQNTYSLGRYWGVRAEGRLVAMAGERMKQPGFTEISAVCVHPDHRRRGHGARLTAAVAAAIEARGNRPYLHALADNRGAIRLYEKLGFRVRSAVQVAWLEPPAARAERDAEILVPRAEPKPNIPAAPTATERAGPAFTSSV